MYVDALSFLEDERAAWVPFEALATLDDEAFDRPVAAAHGWSARDLAVHLVYWQEHALEVARELAVGDTSPAYERASAEWDERGGDAINAEAIERWKDAPAAEVRARMSSVSGELRGYLTVVPETRWVKNAERREFFLGETLDHYEGHLGDLRAILATVDG
ncbi:MAG: maleylpyruvate isomerase N-terminal domain-containing protein [Chloroflexota bacterium]